MDGIENIVKINQKIMTASIELKTKEESYKIIPPNLHKLYINNTIKSYVGKCTVSFYDPNHIYARINKGTEIKVLGASTNELPQRELFYGLIYNKKTSIIKDKNYDEITITSFSFSKLLAETILDHWYINYSKGYGEVIKKLVNNLNLFNIDNVKEENLKGSVFFNNISILDAMRYLAYTREWCIKFVGKSIYFAPCEIPKDSGIKLNIRDLPSVSINEDFVYK